MNSNFARTTATVLFTAIFAACGGGSSVSEAMGDSSVTLPENGGATAPPDLSKQEALSTLNPAVINKVNSFLSGTLDRLLDQTSNEMIVEFVDKSSPTDYLQQKMTAYANTKSQVSAVFSSSDYEVVVDYPEYSMSFVRLKSRRALVDFLNNADVKAIYENLSTSSAIPSDLSKQGALSAFSPTAINKVRSLAPGFLDRLLEQASNDVIAEFVDESSPTDPYSLEQKKLAYANTKNRVATAFSSSEYEVIDEYDALPSSFVRLKSRRALVNFLNNVDVKEIHENLQYSLATLSDS